MSHPWTWALLLSALIYVCVGAVAARSAAYGLGNSSPRELAADPHVRWITEDILKALQADLLAAQSQN